jgi:type VI secretion system protein ImpA
MNSLLHRNFSFEVGRLVHPISAEFPAGENLRYDAVYDQIREARREDDPVLERGVWQIALKKAEWPQVEKLCTEVLEKRSKDLQVAAWLLEAWLRLYGLPGLREGFRLLNALSQDFWETVHPLPEDGDLDYRIAPFEWANEKLPLVLKLIPITNPLGDSSRPYSWADWEAACRPAGRDSDSSQDVTQAAFQQSVLLTSASDFDALLEMTDGALFALHKLTATLNESCGSHSPGFAQMGSTLNSIRGLLQSILSQRPKTQAVTLQPEPGKDLSMAVDPKLQEPEEALESGVFSAGPIRSRAEAYRRLSEAADYLARTEPHSPTPYLVKRAIAWGGMKLEDLLPELVRNNSELSEIYRLLQIGRQE